MNTLESTPRRPAQYTGRHHPKDQSAAWLLNDSGMPQVIFDVGETIYLAAHGLHPAMVYEITLASSEYTRPVAQLMTDRYGNLPPTALLPYFGLVGVPNVCSSLIV